MKRCHSFLPALLLLLCYTPLLISDTEVSGGVRGTWDLERSPYISTSRAWILRDRSLTIEPGVEIISNGAALVVYGRLQAQGELRDSIRFGPSGQDGWQGVCFTGADGESSLDYCVITGGHADEGEGLDSLANGGNIFISNSDITVSHSRISRGHCTGFGAGVSIWNSDVTFVECLINENSSADSAAGIGFAYGARGEFINCRIFNNHANENGGGMYFWGQSSPTIEGCHFYGNSAGLSGGGVNISNGSDPHIHNCTFTRNTAEAGGAVYIRANGTSPLIEWCLFEVNAANIGDRVGGAFFIRGGASPEIRFNRIVMNNADRGGGLYMKERPQCNIHHNLFLKNGATLGGGAFATSSDLRDTPLRLDNCTFINNQDIGIEAEGHTGYVREGAIVSINSSIVWGVEPHFFVEGGLGVTYSNVRFGYEGEGNSEEDPDFFGDDSTWFLLSGNSPCVDSGDPEFDEDPDESRSDRGWMYFPHNANIGVENDTLETALWVDQTEDIPLRFTNLTGVPLYITPMDRWSAGEPVLLCNVSEITGDNEIYGAAWTSEGFFLSGANNGDSPNMIYHLDGDMNLVNSFPQPGNPGGEGFCDLATGSGNILYGGYSNYIYEFTTEGEFGDRYAGPNDVRQYRALGADIHNPHGFLDFYIAGSEGIILRTDSEMWERARIDIGEPVYALSVKWNSRALYIMTRPEPGNYLLSLVIPDEELVIPLYLLEPPEGNYTIGGIEVTQDWETGRGSLVGIWRDAEQAGDMLFIYDLYTVWLKIIPETKLLMPDEETEWSITFIGDQLESGEYESMFYLPVNGINEGMEVYAHLETMSLVRGDADYLPDDCRLISVYPNPFNSSSSFRYYLSKPQPYQLYIIDQIGRRVLTIDSGIGQSGIHSGTIDADRLSSGTYYLKLTTGKSVDVKPLTIIK